MVKKSKIRPARRSNQFMVRLPDGIRKQLADMAARHGNSMDAEVVTALVHYVMGDGEPLKDEIRTAIEELRQEIKELRKALGRGILEEKVDAIMRHARAFEEAVDPGRQKLRNTPE